MVVDAIDEAAAAFYEHHDFKRVMGRADRLDDALIIRQVRRSRLCGSRNREGENCGDGREEAERAERHVSIVVGHGKPVMGWA